MDAINSFFAGKCFAVAGASSDRSKYGNIVFRALLESGRRVYPINPKGELIEGHPSFQSLSDLPEVPDSLSIVTPPEVTRRIVADAIALGIKNLWMQPFGYARTQSATRTVLVLVLAAARLLRSCSVFRSPWMVRPRISKSLEIQNSHRVRVPLR